MWKSAIARSNTATITKKATSRPETRAREAFCAGTTVLSRTAATAVSTRRIGAPSDTGENPRAAMSAYNSADLMPMDRDQMRSVIKEFLATYTPSAGAITEQQ